MSATLPLDLWGWQKGPEAARGDAAPASALIHQNRNIGIEHHLPVLQDEFKAAKEKEATDAVTKALPPHLKKKTFAIRLRIEWMVRTYGLERIGLQTMTVRDNLTDRKEFERRFKSIATNVFPELYLDWLRVFERQQRGAWHAHVVVATKDDIRTGTDVVALNQLLKDKRDRKITKAVYYSGIKRLASPNLKAIWKEFRRLCGLGEFKERRKGRYYKFDACHLLPIISTAQALAAYVSKYISKGFEHRRPEDKGMRLVGSTRRVSWVCNERFSWVGGGSRLFRAKLGILAGLLNIKSLDEFAERYGPKWPYHLEPVLADIVLPHYENMKLAKLDGWDLKNDRGEPWPFSGLSLPEDFVFKSHLRAYVQAKEIELRRCAGGKRRLAQPRTLRAWVAPPPRPRFKSWIELTAKED